MMRLIRVVLVAGGVLGCPLILIGQAPDAGRGLAAAREALGGERALANVRAFCANGRTRQLRGNNLIPIEFEINCELPDRFVRRDEIPAQDTDLTVVGFVRDATIQFPVSPANRPAPQRLTTIKQDFAR